MRLATVKNGAPDGQLVVVSPDGSACAKAPVATLQTALENWQAVAPQLAAISAFDQPLEQVAAPLPRAWQWLDGSVFASHGTLMDKMLGIDKPPVDFPLMYQGVSDKFYGPTDDVVMAGEEYGIDFEGEFGVITGKVPMSCTAPAALRHIRLLVQINDWSLRAIAPVEMKTGFGWIQAKRVFRCPVQHDRISNGTSISDDRVLLKGDDFLAPRCLDEVLRRDARVRRHQAR